MLHDHDLDIQIAVWPAVGAAFTFAGYPQLLPGLNAGRDLDVDAHAFMFITLAAALGAFFTDFLTRAAAVRADTLGLVTLEDLLEEIVGEIRDEYDADEEDDITRISDREFYVLGSANLNDEIGRAHV